MFHRNLFQKIFSIQWISSRSVRNLLDQYGQVYRPEVQSELEYLAVQTSRNKSLEINYQLEQQRRRQRTIRYHILRRKYVVHPNDLQVNLFVKNHMQFLHKNYPNRWTVSMLAESFNQSEENVRLILQQRTRRRLRVRPRSPSSSFGIKDPEEREKQIDEHILQRDITHWKSSQSNEDPVDSRILAEESDLLPRHRPSQTYLSKQNDGFFSNVLSKKDPLISQGDLLDRMNKLRVSSTNNDGEEESNNVLNEERWKILKKMQQTNDDIVTKNELKQKYLHRIVRSSQ